MTLLFAYESIAYASQYTLLEPSIVGGQTSVDAGTYLSTLYTYAIGVAGVLAVIMFAIGGIHYMFPGKESKGKEFMTNAVFGIILALAAYLILNTINPDILKSNISLPTGTTTAVAPPPVQEDDDYEAGAPTTPVSGTAGSCGGMNVSVPSQCALASSELNGILSCMKGKGITATVTSVTSQSVGGNLTASQACCGTASCTHSTNSCHYGCPATLSGSWQGEKGYSHAVDIGINGMSQSSWCAIATVAKSCGAGMIWGPADACSGAVKYYSGHGTHLHISTRSCNH